MSKPRAKTASKKSAKRITPKVVIYIIASFNNTMVTVTTPQGDVIAWSSSGSHGFKGSRKSTPFAAQTVVEHVAKRVAEENGVKEADVLIKGPGGGREAAMRAVPASGITVTSIKDVTPLPHNGVRKKKRRRV